MATCGEMSRDRNDFNVGFYRLNNFIRVNLCRHTLVFVVGYRFCENLFVSRPIAKALVSHTISTQNPQQPQSPIGHQPSLSLHKHPQTPRVLSPPHFIFHGFCFKFEREAVRWLVFAPLLFPISFISQRCLLESADWCQGGSDSKYQNQCFKELWGLGLRYVEIVGCKTGELAQQEWFVWLPAISPSLGKSTKSPSQQYNRKHTHINQLLEFNNNKCSSVRYFSVIGLLVLGYTL